MSEQTSSGGLISPSDIADLAGKSRAAVSYWRKHEADFPSPVTGTAARPLFDRIQVERWLRHRNALGGQNHGAIAVWAALNSMRGAAAMESLVAELHRILAIRKIALTDVATSQAWESARAASGREVTDWLLRAEDSAAQAWSEGAYALQSRLMRELPSEGLSQLVRAVEDAPAERLADVSDNALNKLVGGAARGGGEHGLPESRTAAILAAASRQRGGLAYDPACGIAQGLILFATRTPGAPRIVGNEINIDAYTIATVRALLRGIDAQFLLGNVLVEDPNPDLRADVILAEPPFGLRWDPAQAPFDPRWTFGVAPKSSSDLAWVQHALFHLAPDGVAYVLTPMGPLFRGGAEQKIRSGLVATDVIETIVGLPGKLVPHTSIPLTLWVLRRERRSQSRTGVTFIDASEEVNIEGSIAAWLDAVEAGIMPEVPSTHVEATDLIAAGADLLPNRWIARPGKEAGAVREQLSAAFSELEKVASAIEPLSASPSVSDGVAGATRIASVRELVSLGLASAWQGRVSVDEMSEKTDLRGIVTTRAVRDGLPAFFGYAGDLERLREERVTQAGDVLLTTMGRVRAIVDHAGGRIPARGVHVLRLDPATFDPEYVAIALSGEWNDAYQRGSTLTHAAVKDLEIPVLSLADQRDVVGGVARLRSIAEKATALAEAAKAASVAALDVVRYGAEKRR